MLLDKKGICELIPHRDPFLFIDAVKQITCGDRHLKPREWVEKDEVTKLEIQCEFFVSPDLFVFQGHFPGRPVFPGVLQVEMMAQAACLMFSNTGPDIKVGPLFQVALVSCDRVKFRKPVMPSMKLDVITKCTRVRRQMMSYDCQVFNEGQVCSQATILATHFES